MWKGLMFRWIWAKNANLAEFGKERVNGVSDKKKKVKARF